MTPYQTNCMTQYYKLLIIIGFCFTSPITAQDLFSKDNSRKYCNYLLETSQYDALLIEQLRIYKEQPKTDSLNKEIYRTYLILRDYKHLGEFVKSNKRSFNTLELLDVWVLTMQLDSLENHLKINQKDSTLLKYRLIVAILKNEQKAAKQIFKQITDSTLIFAFNPVFTTFNNRPKSVFIAGALATLVPGLGKLYLGKKRDALSAFTITGVFVWQSIVGFNKKGIKSSYGLINGTFGLGFYLGNIYGSVRSAKIINHERRNLIYNQIVDAVILR